MRYTVRKSIVRLVGTIWMPSATCAQEKLLSSYDVENIRGQAAYRLGITLKRDDTGKYIVGNNRYQTEEQALQNHKRVKITRDDVEQWLITNSGDFQSVTDFYASIEDGNKTLEFPWSSEDSECTYGDCMYPSEDD